MSLKLKNFGLLEFLIIISAVYVVGMLIWTASTRPEVEARANLVKENHKKVVDFINGEIILRLKIRFQMTIKLKQTLTRE